MAGRPFSIPRFAAVLLGLALLAITTARADLCDSRYGALKPASSRRTRLPLHLTIDSWRQTTLEQFWFSRHVGGPEPSHPLISVVTGLPGPVGGWKSFEEFRGATSHIFPESPSVQRLCWEAYSQVLLSKKTPWLAVKETYLRAGVKLEDRENDKYLWLSTPKWSPVVNDFFVLGIIHARRPVRLDAEGMRPQRDGNRIVRTTGIEYRQLLEAGWDLKPDGLWHPPPVQ